ncbi:hypothetical protein B0H14DRAFT_3616007 [Mycena olivaceomarginata]|nr:hypothetical protein B0H14DRAFT_3616007 [Mycena olivaceomarginata]
MFLADPLHPAQPQTPTTPSPTSLAPRTPTAPHTDPTPALLAFLRAHPTIEHLAIVGGENSGFGDDDTPSSDVPHSQKQSDPQPFLPRLTHLHAPARARRAPPRAHRRRIVLRTCPNPFSEFSLLFDDASHEAEQQVRPLRGLARAVGARSEAHDGVASVDLGPPIPHAASSPTILDPITISSSDLCILNAKPLHRPLTPAPDRGHTPSIPGPPQYFVVLSLSNRESLDPLETWREALRHELRTNTSGLLPHRCPQLANTIPADFPDPTIINLYLHPIVSEPAVASDLVFRFPRLDVLARFAEENFQWGDSVGILDHFADHLFAGFVIRELACRASVVDGTVVALSSSPSVIKCIVRERRHKSMGYLVELRLTLSLDPAILTMALQATDGRRNPPEGAQTAVAAWIKEKLPKIRVWVPKSMGRACISDNGTRLHLHSVQRGCAKKETDSAARNQSLKLQQYLI